MINIQTYRLEPYLAANTQHEVFSTEWLREGINKLMRTERKSLEEAGADVSLFFNHHPETGRTRIGYPLIIYHYLDGRFYITGINQGALSLSLLAAHYESPFSIDDVVFQGFKKESSYGEFDMGITSEPRLYALIKWLPLHHKDLKAFRKMDMVMKVTELNQRLEKHIDGELGKYLGISFSPLRAVITDITMVYPHPVMYKGYEYPAFDIRFTANVTLPWLITLGNNKALGYGRVAPI